MEFCFFEKLRDCSPKSEVITTCGVVVTHVVSRMCYPECSRSDVIAQETGRGDNKHSQVILDDVSLEQQRKTAIIRKMKVINYAAPFNMITFSLNFYDHI